MNKNKQTYQIKAEISIQTIFFILMSILIIVIIIYGINKIFLVNDTLTEQDRISVQKEITKAITYCDDPLNKGNIKTFTFENSYFDGIWILGNDIENLKDSIENKDELKLIFDSGDNIVLFKTINSEYPDINNDNIYDIYSINIISSFKLDQSFEKTKYWFDFNKNGIFNIEVKCN